MQSFRSWRATSEPRQQRSSKVNAANEERRTGNLKEKSKKHRKTFYIKQRVHMWNHTVEIGEGQKPYKLENTLKH